MAKITKGSELCVYSVNKILEKSSRARGVQMHVIDQVGSADVIIRNDRPRIRGGQFSQSTIRDEYTGVQNGGTRDANGREEEVTARKTRRRTL